MHFETSVKFEAEFPVETIPILDNIWRNSIGWNIFINSKAICMTLDPFKLL